MAIRTRKRKLRATSWAGSSAAAEKSPKSERAYRSLIRLLARRDYSEKELREKLSDRFTDEAIQTAITKAHEQRWIKDPFELAERWSEHLHRKGKGHRSVAHALQERGLPPVERDPDRELEKAKALLDKKFPGKAKLSVNERQKAYRYLAYRGFDFETIAVLLKSERVNHEEF